MIALDRAQGVAVMAIPLALRKPRAILAAGAARFGRRTPVPHARPAAPFFLHEASRHEAAMVSDDVGGHAPAGHLHGIPFAEALEAFTDPSLTDRVRSAGPIQPLHVNRYDRFSGRSYIEVRSASADPARVARQARIGALWQGLRDGTLQAHGRRGNVAAPFEPIEPDVWPYLKLKSTPAGHVVGRGVEFFGVRVRKADVVFAKQGLSVPVPGQSLTSTQLFDACVQELREAAEASRELVTLERSEHRKRWMDRGMLDKAYRDAREKALADYPAWTRRGRPKASDKRGD